MTDPRSLGTSRPAANRAVGRDEAAESSFGEALLLARDVGKVFQTKTGRVEALSSVSLTVNRGEFVSLLGPSGCGKSTLLAILSGLDSPSSGDVLVGDTRVRGPLRQIGVVFQRDLLLEWRTALDNVLMQYEMRGVKPRQYEEEARELLDSVGLGGFADRYPWQLSGGMRQRVAICRALIHRPEILFMDEPFGAVDALTRERLNVELSRLAIQPPQKTVVFVTHDIDEAVFLADRVVIMSPRPGRVVAEQDVRLDKPRTDEMRESVEFMEHVARVRELLRHHGVLST
jgi:NitT/TauT family transport system ATP-binding protein